MNDILPATPERRVVDWVRSRAIPLATVEPRHGWADLEALRSIVGDARILSLGEATHGTREFFKLKHRILEFCVAELGFTTFIIEAPFAESLAVNAYVREGVGNAAEALARGRSIGLVPEIKHSTYFAAIGLPLEERFVASVARHDYARRCPLIVQSFEVANLRALKGRLANPRTRLMQLVTGQEGARPADVAAAGGALTYRAMMTPAGLAEMAGYADILSPEAGVVIPRGPDQRLLPPSGIVAQAHRAGLVVMPWTFRPENFFLAADFRDAAGAEARNPTGSVAEIGAYLAAGIDGFFTDDPALGRAAVDAVKGR